MNALVWGLVLFSGIVVFIDIMIHLLTLKIALPIFERQPPFNVRKAPVDPQARAVRIPTTDGLTLAGSVWRPLGQPKGLIVFFPECQGFHTAAIDHLGGLVDEGYALFSFDFRNQGASEHEEGYKPSHWLTEREVSDALAALKFIENDRELREYPIGFFGVSRGANTALATAARVPHVKGVVAEGAFSTDQMMLYYAFRWAALYTPRWLLACIPEWHLAWTLRTTRRFNGWRRGVRYTVLESWLPRLSGRPTLLIAGGRDSYVAPAIVEHLRTKIGADTRPVWVVPGAKHNLARWTAPEEFEARLLTFFDDALGGFHGSTAEVEADTLRLAEIAR